MDKLRNNPWLIGGSLLFCFPLGLALIWTNPVWSRRTKAIWTGGLVAVGVPVAVIAAKQEAAARRELAEADRLWGAGQKAEAVTKYKTALDRGVSNLDPSQRPTVFQRVIEYEAEQGNTSAAKALIEKADGYGVPLASEAPAAKSLLAEAQARKDAAKHEAQTKKDAEQYKDARKNAKGDQLKGMGIEDIEKLLGPPDERYQSAKTPNAFLYVWDDGNGSNIAVSFIRRLDNGRSEVIVAADGRSRPVVENMKKALDKF